MRFYADMLTRRPHGSNRRSVRETVRLRQTAEAARDQAWIERRKLLRPVSVLAIADYIAQIEVDRARAAEAHGLAIWSRACAPSWRTRRRCRYGGIRLELDARAYCLPGTLGHKTLR